MTRPEFIPHMLFCPKCEDVFDSDEFDFLGLIKELGNVTRFRCHHCRTEFDALAPDPSVEDFMRAADTSLTQGTNTLQQFGEEDCEGV